MSLPVDALVLENARKLVLLLRADLALGPEAVPVPNLDLVHVPDLEVVLNLGPEAVPVLNVDLVHAQEIEDVPVLNLDPEAAPAL